MLPSTDQPVITQAEKDLFAFLYPQFRSRRGKVDYVGLKAAFNAAFYAQVMPGQPGQPLTSGAAMIFSKSVKHLKHYALQHDRETRVRENIAFNRAISKAPLPPPLEQGQTKQITMAEALSRGQKRKLEEPPVAVVSPLGATDDQAPILIAAAASPSPSRGLLSRAYEAAGSIMGSIMSSISPVRGEAAQQQVVAPAAKEPTAAPDGKAAKQLCGACLLVSNLVCYKVDHPQKHSRGVCPAQHTREQLRQLKTAAMARMAARKFVKRGNVSDYNSPTYLSFLAQ